MKKLVLFLLAALLSFAVAEDINWAEELSNKMARELNGVTRCFDNGLRVAVEESKGFCFFINSRHTPIDTKEAIDDYISGFGDVSWLSGWNALNRDDLTIYRILVFEEISDTILFLLHGPDIMIYNTDDIMNAF